jgi:putative DNA primase/helicase
MNDIASPISAFVRDCCIKGEQYRAAIDDLYASWCDWCKEQGREHPGTKQMFGRDLTAAVQCLKVVQPRDGEGGRYRAYDGIGIVSNSTSTHGF